MHPLSKAESSIASIELMKTRVWTFLRWWSALVNLQRSLSIKNCWYFVDIRDAKDIKCFLERWKKHETMFPIVNFFNFKQILWIVGFQTETKGKKFPCWNSHQFEKILLTINWPWNKNPYEIKIGKMMQGWVVRLLVIC